MNMSQPVSLKYQNELKAFPKHEILERAADIISQSFADGDAYTDPSITKEFLRYQLATEEREVFSVMFLNNQNQLIEFKSMFYGTVNAASVYPREVVKTALSLNAAAVILAHNHPSGEAEPSQADIHITQRLKQALELVDIRVLDHIIVGAQSVSLAQRGVL